MNDTSCLSKSFDDSGKIQQEAREPIDLVDHNGVDPFGRDRVEQPF